MKYLVSHRTEYFYDELVPLCHNVLRLRPRDSAYQTCLRHELTSDPRPAVQRDRVDFFGNHVTWLSVQIPHRQLKISAVSEVEVTPMVLPEKLTGPPWDSVTASLIEKQEPEVLGALQYTFESPHVPLNAELADFARQDFAAGAPLVPCMRAFNQRIFKEFSFDPTATTISTPVMEVLRRRRGVCQDFAHLAIAGLRSLGLAARYVSGYLNTQPPPGKERLVGVDASHAWLGVYVPDHGWIDMDPTNGILPQGGHITLAWARDYDDLSPVRGVMVGGERHSLNYAVDVEPLAAAAAAS